MNNVKKVKLISELAIKNGRALNLINGMLDAQSMLLLEKTSEMANAVPNKTKKTNKITDITSGKKGNNRTVSIIPNSSRKAKAIVGMTTEKMSIR